MACGLEAESHWAVICLLPAARHVEQAVDALALDQALDHRCGRHAINVADHAAELDAAVVQHLVQPVDLGAVHVGELAPVARDQAQLAQILGRDEAGANQAKTGQHGQPLRIAHVGLAPGSMFNKVGVDDPGRNAGVLQVRMHALPVDAGALMTTSSTRSSLSQAARARQSRRKPPNSRLVCSITPSGCSTTTVTTCSMR